MTHDLFRLESEVRELRRWYARDAERIAFLEDRVASLLAGAGEPVTRLPSRPYRTAREIVGAEPGSPLPYACPIDGKAPGCVYGDYPAPPAIAAADLAEARDQERARCAAELRAYAERQGSSPPLRSPKGLAMELAMMLEAHDS